MRHRDKPRFGAMIDGHDPILIDRVLPLVDIVEITPDRWAASPADGAPRIPDEALDTLAGIAAIMPVVAHGSSLSLASHDDWNEAYLDLMDQLSRSRVELRWHSEHAAFSHVDGEALGVQVEPPRSEETLALLTDRVARLQDRIGLPFLVEPVARRFADSADDTFAAADFLNELVRRTDCLLLLDVHGLECDEHNFGIDPIEFVERLDLSSVREVHIGGGAVHRGFKLGFHSRLVETSTITLTRRILARARRVEAVIFEVLEEALPLLGYEAVAGELFHLRAELDLV